MHATQDCVEVAFDSLKCFQVESGKLFSGCLLTKIQAIQTIQLDSQIISEIRKS